MRLSKKRKVTMKKLSASLVQGARPNLWQLSTASKMKMVVLLVRYHTLICFCYHCKCLSFLNCYFINYFSKCVNSNHKKETVYNNNKKWKLLHFLLLSFCRNCMLEETSDDFNKAVNVAIHCINDHKYYEKVSTS